MDKLSGINDVDLLVKMQGAYKQYNLSLLVFIILRILILVVSFFIVPSRMVYISFNMLILVILFWFLFSVYNLTLLMWKSDKKQTRPLFWLVLMFIPLANLVGILLLFHGARKVLKQLSVAKQTTA